MRQFNLTILIAILLMTLTCNQTSKSNNSTVKQQPDNSISSNLDFLKELNGKYPFEVKLFKKSAFTKRLKKLIGNSRYRFLKKT